MNPAECTTCQHWCLDTMDIAETGWCRRYPPTRDESCNREKALALFPRTPGGSLCGEFASDEGGSQ